MAKDIKQIKKLGMAPKPQQTFEVPKFEIPKKEIPIKQVVTKEVPREAPKQQSTQSENKEKELEKILEQSAKERHILESKNVVVETRPKVQIQPHKEMPKVEPAPTLVHEKPASPGTSEQERRKKFLEEIEQWANSA